MMTVGAGGVGVGRTCADGLRAVTRARNVGFVRWLVDGMNVIEARPDGWWKDRRCAMVGLVDRLERWASA